MPNYEEILKNEAFSSLTDGQKTAYIELAQNLNGKNMNESLMIMMGFMKNMPKGRSLTADEQSAMIDAVLKSLPEDEAKKFQNITKLFAR